MVFCGFMFCFFEWLWIFCDRRKKMDLFAGEDDEVKHSMAKHQRDSETVVKMNEIKLDFEDDSSDRSSFHKRQDGGSIGV